MTETHFAQVCDRSEELVDSCNNRLIMNTRKQREVKFKSNLGLLVLEKSPRKQRKPATATASVMVITTASKVIAKRATLRYIEIMVLAQLRINTRARGEWYESIKGHT